MPVVRAEDVIELNCCLLRCIGRYWHKCMVRPCVARVFADLVVSGLASMYPASDWSVLCFGPRSVDHSSAKAKGRQTYVTRPPQLAAKF